MVRTAKIGILFLAALVALAACSSSAQEPTQSPVPPAPSVESSPSPEPTSSPAPLTASPVPTLTLTPSSTPTPAPHNAWNRIEDSGTIVVGTAADYPPFEYYTGVESEEGPELTGFDIALMDEIGDRLGVEVEYRDFAFDGLSSALVLGQIDAAIAAISVTRERESIVDFTDVYYVGEDAFLAAEGSSVDAIEDVNDLAGLRIGAQRSTVYADWLRTNLAETGILPSDQLFLYERAEDAVRDLREGRLDLVMLDAAAAEAFADAGRFKVIGNGLNQQRLAIALPKGATSLKEQLDRTLTTLRNEGFVARLAQEYLDIPAPLVSPTATPTPEPQATATATPRPTSTPAPPLPCLDGLAFVQHLNYNDQNMTAPTLFGPGQSFTKAWRVQNTGTCTWDSAYRLVFGSGNDTAARMGGEPVAVQGQLAPGETYDLQIDLVAPLKPGTYQAFWQMENDKGQAFGERLPVGIRVLAPPTPTPAPTQTPVAGIQFRVDRTDIKAGECVVFGWRVENVKAVYFYAEGERWQDNGVVGEAQQRECPPHNTTYYLRVVKRDDSVETRQIAINVQPAPQAPVIQRFTVDPPNQIAAGQCVTIRWAVEGQVNRVRIAANGNSLWDNAPLSGKLQDCPRSSGTVGYGVEAWGPGGTSRGQQTVNVVGAATAAPPPPPPPDRPVIHAFSVRPEQIGLGGCVTLAWKAGGGTSWINIFRGERMVWENAPLTGSVQDCPDATGTHQYRLIAYNPQDKRTHQDQFVTVTAVGPR